MNCEFQLYAHATSFEFRIGEGKKVLELIFDLRGRQKADFPGERGEVAFCQVFGVRESFRVRGASHAAWERSRGHGEIPRSDRFILLVFAVGEKGESELAEYRFHWIIPFPP